MKLLKYFIIVFFLFSISFPFWFFLEECDDFFPAGIILFIFCIYEYLFKESIQLLNFCFLHHFPNCFAGLLCFLNICSELFINFSNVIFSYCPFHFMLFEGFSDKLNIFSKHQSKEIDSKAPFLDDMIQSLARFSLKYFLIDVGIELQKLISCDDNIFIF